MLLVIDVGNTNTVLGAYREEVLVSNWRIRTERNITEDEFSLLVSQLLAKGNVDLAQIKKTVISCVVPPMVRNLNAFCEKYLNQKPKWVDARSSGILPILMKNPSEVGADRIVNAVAAHRRYKQSLIVIDFGTATTFDAISEKGAYIGGAISPGIMISAEALFMHASKLPRVEIFQLPEKWWETTPSRAFSRASFSDTRPWWTAWCPA